ncbi:unnamed protein product [Trichogramma brassicae]|uniref:Uncharacterized protein n=1 Tax=Trichogramma brassicae TaxID=86971 RepID=A0A6H5IVF7_9HYME|nr:unnamed protein product [Trichogramma brassicae]
MSSFISPAMSRTRREYCPRSRFPRGSRPGFTRSEHHVTLDVYQVEILYFWTVSSRKSTGFYPFRAPRLFYSSTMLAHLTSLNFDMDAYFGQKSTAGTVDEPKDVLGLAAHLRQSQLHNGTIQNFVLFGDAHRQSDEASQALLLFDLTMFIINSLIPVQSIVRCRITTASSVNHRHNESYWTRIRMSEERQLYINIIDLREIVRKKNIDAFLAYAAIYMARRGRHETQQQWQRRKRSGAQIIDLIGRSSFVGVPDLDRAGRPILRRTTPIHRAAKVDHYRGRGETIHELFKVYNRLDANYVDEDGFTHFHIACAYNCDKIVEGFLRMEMAQDPDCRVGKTGDTLLHLALDNGHWTIAHRLLLKFADPNSANAEGLTPLHVVCRRRHHEDGLAELFMRTSHCLGRRVLIDARDKWGRTALHYAVADIRKRETVGALLRWGADPNAADDLEGSTPLHVVCRHSYDDVARLYLRTCHESRRPALVDARDREGKTPLHWALLRGHKGQVELLLRQGADPNVADAKGRTPLHVLGRRGAETKDFERGLAKRFFEIVDELPVTLRIDAKDNSGRTAFADYFGRRFEPGDELTVAPGALACLEALEARGYRPDRVAASTIVKLLDEHELFDLTMTSTDLDQDWLYRLVSFFFADEAARKLTIRPGLSLHDLTRLRPREAAKLLAYEDLFEFARSASTSSLSMSRTLGMREDKFCWLCAKYLSHLFQIMSRRFFRRWALEMGERNNDGI